VSLLGNILNPIGYPGEGPFAGDFLGGNVNTYVDTGRVRGLLLSSQKYQPDDPDFGTLALTTDWPAVGHRDTWLRGSWFDALHDFWSHYSVDGTLPECNSGPSPDGSSDVGSLWLRTTLQPGDAATLPLFISWHFPNMTLYWKASRPNSVPPPMWRNYYSTQWRDALGVADYYAQ